MKLLKSFVQNALINRQVTLKNKNTCDWTYLVSPCRVTQ